MPKAEGPQEIYRGNMAKAIKRNPVKQTQLTALFLEGLYGNRNSLTPIVCVCVCVCVCVALAEFRLYRLCKHFYETTLP
jgi:hypothetical protein